MIDRTRDGQNGVAADIPLSLVDRLSGAVRGYLQDKASAWLSPLLPQTPVVPGAAPRLFDYPPGYNIATQPRSYEKTTFATLRALADNYDLMRGVIETRKDQVSSQTWTIRLKKQEGEPDKKYTQRNASDARLKTLRAFWRQPDKEHDFSAWVRMLVEEVLVIDAPCIYPRFTYGGDLFCFDLIDGATIKRVISDEGKTPLAPLAAYQQIIKGVPYCNFTRPQNEYPEVPQLVYAMRNPRVNRVYGLSPVEQVMMTVNIALRRQLHVLNYYTEGNIPDAIAGVPEKWTPDQISKFEAKWDSIFAGDSAQRRKIKFVPWGGTGQLPLQLLKSETLKDEMDEFIVRLVCFFFSIPPNALIKQVNRASGEQMSEQAKDEGLVVLNTWLQNTITNLIEFYFGYDDIEFSFEDKKNANAKEQAEIDASDIKAGVISVDDRREKLGLEPLGMEPAFFNTNNEPLLVEDVVSGDFAAQQEENRQNAAASAQASVNAQKPSTPDDGSQSASKKVVKKTTRKKKLRVPMGRFTRAMTKRAKRVSSSIEKFFHKQAKQIATTISGAYADAQKSAADDILKRLDLDDWTSLRDIVRDAMQLTMEDAANKALVDLGVDDASAVFGLVNKWAVEYAERRSAELVGKRVAEDGTLYDNPSTKWSVPNTTRERIRQLVENALESGQTAAELKEAILDDYAFSEYRAEMISRTELAFANVKGNAKAALESGVVVKKQWILGSEHDTTGCECEDNADDGVIDVDADFSSGDDEPPHPNCVCDIVYYTSDETDESE